LYSLSESSAEPILRGSGGTVQLTTIDSLTLL